LRGGRSPAGGAAPGSACEGEPDPVQRKSGAWFRRPWRGARRRLPQGAGRARDHRHGAQEPRPRHRRCLRPARGTGPARGATGDLTRAGGRAKPRAVLGIIGGSGIYDLPGLTGVRREKVRTPFADPVCPQLHEHLNGACFAAGATVHPDGTYLCIEGPQFSTRAESQLYRSWGIDVIGMTAMPEAKLAREAELCYATVALATDYDCWHSGHDAVTVAQVIETMNKNVATAREVIRNAVLGLGRIRERTCACGHALD